MGLCVSWTFSESGIEGKGVDLRDSNAENWGDQQNKNFVYEFC